MRLLVMHLGTRGGGPQLHAAISSALNSTTSVELLLVFDSASEKSPALRELRVPHVEVGRFASRAGMLRWPLRILAQPRDAYLLLRFCREQGVEVVFEPMGHPLHIVPRWLIRRGGVKVITSIHDVSRHAGEENALLAWLARADMSDTDGIMTYSMAVAAEMGRRRAEVFTTVHGALGAGGGGSPRAAPPRVPVVGFFGRIGQYKGLPRLRDAVAELSRRGIRVDLRVVGRGNLGRALAEELETLGAKVDNRWVAESEIPGIIGSFDILALPYDEASQSGVVGYALSAGVPIVATPVGGLGEQVAAAGGIVARGMTPHDFADVIEELLLSDSTYARTSQAQFEAATGEFGWSRVAHDVVSAARSVASLKTS